MPSSLAALASSIFMACVQLILLPVLLDLLLKTFGIFRVHYLLTNLQY